MASHSSELVVCEQRSNNGSDNSNLCECDRFTSDRLYGSEFFMGRASATEPIVSECRSSSQ